MLLGSDAELVTVPKAELLGVVFGAANTGWFSALNASAWNCIASRSRIWQFRVLEKFHPVAPSAPMPPKPIRNVRRLFASCCEAVLLRPPSGLHHRSPAW